MAKIGVLSRRRFLVGLFAPAIAKPAISQQSPVTKPSPLLPGVHEPEFFFGDPVEFFWADENSGEAHSERGEVVGVAWNFTEFRWEYRITWLTSTAYSVADYPIVDDSLWAANVLSRSTPR